MSDALIGAVITAGVSAMAALIAVIITYALARRREHEADWRKLRFDQYREFIAALSGFTEGRATLEAHRRYTDAFNSMMLVAPLSVLRPLEAYQNETTYRNANRTQDGHDRAYNTLIRALRADIYPRRLEDEGFDFHLLGLHPDAREKGASGMHTETGD
jgi:hypothetical protein